MPSQTSSRTAYRFRSCATICPLAGPLPVNLGLISLRSELSDSVKPTSAHNALTNIVENGVQVQILRDNMPFGRPAAGEFGTYFIEIGIERLREANLGAQCPHKHRRERRTGSDPARQYALWPARCR